MNKYFLGITLGVFSTISIASCPGKILGGYAGYQTRYEGENTLTNVVNKVYAIKFMANGNATATTAKTSMAQTIGLQITIGESKGYSYNKSTCTLRMWDAGIGSTASDNYFVVVDGGKTLYGVGQDVGQNETKTFILSKQ
jgi:hypothetical protein